MKHYGDITKLSGKDLPIVDVITGGSPCQDLSVAGRREGLAGTRSGLFMEQIRIIKEMRNEFCRRLRMRGTNEHIRPRYMVWENVLGTFSSNKGEDFRAVLEETARIADKTAVISKPPKGKWSTSGVILGDGWSIAWRVHDAQFWGVPQRRKRIALVADFGGESAPEILFERKGLSGDTSESGKAGKGVAANAERSIEPSSYTLKIRGGAEFDRYGKKAGKGALIQTEISATLGVSQDQTLICLNDQGGSQMNITQDVTSTLRAQEHGHQPIVVAKDTGAVYAAVDCRNGTENQNINGTLQAKTNGGISYNCNNVCRVDSVVRRLTPLECERLQGYPDGWTDIGEWHDSKGKKHKDADSPRYKALGNSIALPFWQWMAERMVNVLKKDGVDNPTMASLFDGIGGFPLVFNRCGCMPIWASEIEEFPIAVTRKRFGKE